MLCNQSRRPDTYRLFFSISYFAVCPMNEHLRAATETSNTTEHCWRSNQCNRFPFLLLYISRSPWQPHINKIPSENPKKKNITNSSNSNKLTEFRFGLKKIVSSFPIFLESQRVSRRRRIFDRLAIWVFDGIAVCAPIIKQHANPPATQYLTSKCLEVDGRI